MGLQMEFAAGADSVISLVTVPDHLCGWSNLVHGGVLSTILDEIMSWAAIHFLRQLVLTKSMNISFSKSLSIGQELKAEGKMIKKISRHQVSMEGIIYNQLGQECVIADAVFATFSPKLAKRLGISPSEIPDWLLESW